MRMVMILATTAAMLGGCAAMAGRDASAAATIRYETTACFGTCPVYVVTVRPDGSGTFEGRRFTVATGVRAFTASPEAYRRFAAMLAPYRPAAGERLYHQVTPDCGDEVVTDMPGVDVRWSGREEQHISFNFGCGIEKNAAMHEALRAAPDALPIATFIKPATPFSPSR